jgi:hypothetical protein
MTVWYASGQEKSSTVLDSERLMTSAGVRLSRTPLTCPPDAQRIPAMTSDIVMTHRPTTRTGCSETPGAIPATPRALSRSAPMMPATWVPCHELGCLVQYVPFE